MTMEKTGWILVACSLFTALRAQNSVVLPPSRAGVEGNSQTQVPFGSGGRHQQVHGDLRGTAMSVGRMAFRRDGAPDPDFLANGRDVEVELILGEGSYGNVRATFATNYTSRRSVVLSRRVIALPSWNLSQGQPAPFSVSLLFDQPFAVRADHDLVWELAVYSSYSPQISYPTDSHEEDNYNVATIAFPGEGCRATNQNHAMQIDAQGWTSVVPDRIALSWQCHNLPLPSTPHSAFLFGLSDPNLRLPGLCTNLRTDVLASVPRPATEGSMSFATTIPFWPEMVGSTLYAQAVASDAGQSPGLPLVLSHAAATTIPTLPNPIRVTTVSDLNASASGGSISSHRAIVVLLGQ